MTPIAFLFVSRNDYPKFKEICIDGKGLPADYDSYIKKLNEFQEEIRKQGGTTAQIIIEPDDFASWCAQNRKTTDSQARSTYAAFRFAQLNK